jgi:hypothetical protein
MELSIFLAKLLGIYMLLIAAIWIIWKDRFNESIKEIVESKGLIAFSGTMNILLGLAIAIGHPIWHLNWIGLITLLGYLMIIKGILRLLFADKGKKFLPKILTTGYWPIIAILIILGGFLTVSGFMAGI